jgi:hypothetical protein
VVGERRAGLSLNAVSVASVPAAKGEAYSSTVHSISLRRLPTASAESLVQAHGPEGLRIRRSTKRPGAIRP